MAEVGPSQMPSRACGCEAVTVIGLSSDSHPQRMHDTEGVRGMARQNGSLVEEPAQAVLRCAGEPQS